LAEWTCDPEGPTKEVVAAHPDRAILRKVRIKRIGKPGIVAELREGEDERRPLAMRAKQPALRRPVQH
jgi:hypothetical protein